VRVGSQSPKAARETLSVLLDTKWHGVLPQLSPVLQGSALGFTKFQVNEGRETTAIHSAKVARFVRMGSQSPNKARETLSVLLDTKWHGESPQLSPVLQGAALDEPLISVLRSFKPMRGAELRRSIRVSVRRFVRKGLAPNVARAACC
jgi:hypothetical protein